MRDPTGSLVRHAIVAENGVSETVWTSEMTIGVAGTVVVGAGSVVGASNCVVWAGPGSAASARLRSPGVKATTSLWPPREEVAGAGDPPSNVGAAALDPSNGTSPGRTRAFR